MAVSKEPTQQGPAEQRSCYAFGDVIRKYRSRLKYNQRELGKLMGVNQNTICNWETDKNQPDAQAMRGLCLLLDIPLYELFGIEDKHSNAVRSVSCSFCPFTVLWMSMARGSGDLR